MSLGCGQVTPFNAEMMALEAGLTKATKLSQEASSLVEIVKSMQPSSPRRIMIVAAYADSLKVVWATMTGLAFLALLTSFFTRRLNVNRLLGSEQQLQEKKEDDDLGSA